MVMESPTWQRVGLSHFPTCALLQGFERWELSPAISRVASR